MRLMRRLATITATAITLTTLPFAISSADAATAHPSVAATTAVVAPNTAHWVFVMYLPDELWICYYEGNQLVSQGLYQQYSCGGAAPPGQLALWGLTYP